jgi:hydrogenase-4 component F
LCSVGIALALLGNFFLAIAAVVPQGALSLTLVDLIRGASGLHSQWLKAAFLLLVVGYGTKMGLAPMHTWLPDAHSEAPSLVSALLSGALLTCAFLGILRAYQVCMAAGLGPFGQETLLFFGLISMAVATVFILGQQDFKRLLAYSSVEHMGILAVGIGLGGNGLLGALLHAMNHAFTKGALFFIAGNLLAAYASKSTDKVKGALALLPLSAGLWVVGFLAITGMPPFGTFLSELLILQAGIHANKIWVVVLYLFFLAVIFMGMAKIMFRMVQGQVPDSLPKDSRHVESWLVVAPPLVLLSLVLLLGVYLPSFVQDILQQAVRLLGGT